MNILYIYISNECGIAMIFLSPKVATFYWRAFIFNTMKEEWKDIPGFNGRYQVSNYGRARSWCDCNEGKREEPKILKQGRDKDGWYGFISIWKGGKHHMYDMHRLVAELFIPNPDNKPVVHHKDNDKTNCHVDNLEWVTHRENTMYAIKDGRADMSGIVDRKGEDHGMSKLNEEAVRHIRKVAKEGGRFYGQQELADKYGVCKGTIKEVVARRSWQHVK